MLEDKDEDAYDFVEQSFVGKKKKRRKPVVAVQEDVQEKYLKKGEGEGEGKGEERDYTYIEMLRFLKDRQSQDEANKKKEQKSTRLQLPPPELGKVGTKKTLWKNFSAVALACHRNREHMQKFMESESGLLSSLDARGGLVIAGTFKNTAFKQLSSFLGKYVNSFVLCTECKGWETSLTKDPLTRLYSVECHSCTAKHRAPPIRKIFRAKTRMDRKKLRT